MTRVVLRRQREIVQAPDTVSGGVPSALTSQSRQLSTVCETTQQHRRYLALEARSHGDSHFCYACNTGMIQPTKMHDVKYFVDKKEGSVDLCQKRANREGRWMSGHQVAHRGDVLREESRRR